MDEIGVRHETESVMMPTRCQKGLREAEEGKGRRREAAEEEEDAKS